MKPISALKFLMTLVLVITLISCEDKEQERAVTEKEVHPLVLQIFNQAYPGATIKEYAEEIEGEQKYYEISCEFEGRKIDAIYQADGTVTAIEEVITVESLPNNIQQAIAKEFQQFSIKFAEKIEKQGKTFFEVKLLDTNNQKNYELLFTDTGRLIEKDLTDEE